MGWQPRVLITALIAATAATTASPAAAESPPTAQSAGPDAAGVVAQHRVTLVTGDVIWVNDLADGRQMAYADRGSRRPMQILQAGGDLYVLPDDAAPYVRSGQLDRDLFNVTELVEQGYADEDSKVLPLLASYGSATQARTRQSQPAPPGARRTLNLPAINGAALEESKAGAKQFWTALTGADGTSSPTAKPLGHGVAKLWLSEKVTVSLADSVPQVGAPEAWAAGLDGSGVKLAVLDTGVDATHPDLAGRIGATESFVPGESVEDGHGHGTHVAATVGGTGAAAGGTRKGVAPGAEILVGKVLNNGGSGADAWIIAGMQWAVDQGARVVSMSLGGGPSDGTDPLAMAVNNLSATSNTLFVIASGNLLPGETSTQNISTPGSADSALTVGAVSKTDQLANFSHVGPRLNDYAVKPEITAPGVGIIAARAKGTSLGTPVDANYTSLNGTSMATPHVAGAAAILIQEHPDWTAQQVKDALVATAVPNTTNTVFEQGGGRLDVARVTRQQVSVSPSTLSMGFFRWPHDGSHPGVQRTVTYTNSGTSAVTLNLAVTQDAAGAYTVSPSELTVPAGGSAQATLDLDPNKGTVGALSGYLTASDGTTTVHTSLGATKEEEMYALRMHGTARDGLPARFSSVLLWNLDTGEFLETLFRNGEALMRVRPGRYFLVTEIRTIDDFFNSNEYTSFTEPDLRITADTELTFDSREAVPVTVATPQETEAEELIVNYMRTLGDVRAQYSHENLYTLDRLYAMPTDGVTEGQFEFSTQWALMTPDLKLSLAGSRTLIDAEYTFGAPKFDGSVRLPVVNAGNGTDFTGIDVRGKIALMERTDEIQFTQQSENAAAAGARFAIVYNYEPGRLQVFGPPKPIPTVTILQSDGQDILRRLADGPVNMDVKGVANSPFVYDLMLPEQQVPDQSRYTVGSKSGQHKVAQVENTYYAHTAGPTMEGLVAWRPWMSGPFFLFWRDIPTPFHRTQYISADGDGTTWRHYAEAIRERAWVEDEDAQYRPGQVVSRTWFKQVVRPGIPDRTSVNAQPSTRDGDTLRLTLWPFLDADGSHYGELTGTQDSNDVSSAKLSRDGTLVQSKTQARGAWNAVPERTQYQLSLGVERVAPWWKVSPRTDTTWTFWSQRPAAGQQDLLPLLQIDYDLPLNLLNQARDRRLFVARLGAYHQQHMNGPRINSMSVSVSYDDGTTWRPMPVIGGNGEFAALIWNPRVTDTTGYVSLRVTATDTQGNRIEQTVKRAYALVR